jgi:hypothetical protein
MATVKAENLVNSQVPKKKQKKETKMKPMMEEM